MEWNALVSFPDMLLRLSLAILAGGVIGYGRSRRDRAAGFRTYMLISLGAAMTVLISVYDYTMLHTLWRDITDQVGEKFDTARLASQVVAGTGFLGAGIIIKANHQQVAGLTTATGLFATVCAGLAAGAGFYLVVALAIVMVALVLNVMSPLEAAFKRKLRNITLTVEFEKAEDIDEIRQIMEAQGAQIFDIEIERMERTEGHLPSAIFIMQLSKKNHSHSGMLTTIAGLPCVHSVQELIS